MTDTALFETKACKYMPKLMAEFGLSDDEAAAVFGNLGHETGGFRHMQELKPVVKGSRGGFGWAQWTGPRRRLFEQFCTSRYLDIKTDDANYAFLVHELQGPERAAIGAVKSAVGLKAKVIAFEKGYERAGVKHYDKRLWWATVALAAHRRSVTQKPPVAAKKPKPVQDVGAGAAAAGGASLAHYLGVSLEIVAGVLILAAIGWFIWRVWGSK